MSIKTVCETLAESMPRNLRNDIPAIRMALNDLVDSFSRDGYIIRDFSQDRAVANVRQLLTEKD